MIYYLVEVGLLSDGSTIPPYRAEKVTLSRKIYKCFWVQYTYKIFRLLIQFPFVILLNLPTRFMEIAVILSGRNGPVFPAR